MLKQKNKIKMELTINNHSQKRTGEEAVAGQRGLRQINSSSDKFIILFLKGGRLGNEARRG